MASEMLGQPFFERVDDQSPKSEIVHPAVINRMAAAFKGSNYDIKALLRTLTNSQAYQRQTRLGDALNSHLQFAAVYPVRLRASVLWDALARVLVRMPTTERQTLAFLSEFLFDPSAKADEVAGSIGQALWLLNSDVVNERTKVGNVQLPPIPKKDGKGPSVSPPEPTLLKQLLAKHGADDSAIIRDLFGQTLARKPTDGEMRITLEYIKETKLPSTREQALEDIFKALINGTEFQRRR
jgi:hypothetical protein